MLLLDVQVDIAPEKEAVLNEWYYAHVPRLLTVPGYVSGRRYVSLTHGPRYLALYEIREDSYLPSLLGSDRSLRHELTISEWSRWDRDLVPHMSHCKTNVYRAQDNLCLPLIGAHEAIVVVRLGRRGDDRSRTRDIVGAAIGDLVLNEPEALSARLLERADNPAIDWLGTSPELLILIECAGPAAAQRLALQEGRLEKFVASLRSVEGAEAETTAYAIIARHWPRTKGAPHDE